ncbi:thioether cross-link-forming SCIFF peptide maturase [uncultured Peptoniphilus sp.]|uniref:thioether cross-link-forming SCIFF peptide maturase n=1 Tax=uncultured Peptoniphilus sp. TaxID=254354 RepID=UPI002804790C|nr:thioether cross-link-forming SCIFF peptide maturase [uncultured Peptoniphilus sp.]
MTDIHKFYLNGKYVVLDIPSGSVHIVDELVYKIIDDYKKLNKEEIIEKYRENFSMKTIDEAIDEIEYLIEEEMLFSEDMKYLKPMYNPQNVVKAMCLNVSHDCNLRCKYCFASQGDFHGQRLLMDLDTGKRALEYLIENSGYRRNLEVDFFGGEPLMNFNLVKELVKYGREIEGVHNKHFRFTITTNGTLLTDDKIDFINENMDNCVLSLDGRKCVNDLMRPTVGGKGSYDTIIPKFKKLISKRGDKDYFIRGTFTNENLDFSEDLMDYYKQGFKKTSIEPVVTDEKEPYAIRAEHLQKILVEYEKLSKEYIEIKKEDKEFSFFHFIIDLSQGPCAVKRTVGCGAGSEYIAVTPEGDIYPCHQFVGEKEFKMGDIFNGIKRTDIRDSFKTANVYTNEDCPECWARYYCSGGCHANAYYANNNIHKPYKIGCEMEKKRIECAISILANQNS